MIVCRPPLLQQLPPLLLGPSERVIADRERPGVEQLSIREHSRIHANRHERSPGRASSLVGPQPFATP
jgi:hypothetical protein